MQERTLLQTLIKKSSGIHQNRLEVLLTAAVTLVKCRSLSIADLGRGILNRTKVKHNINRMNRLVGNAHLHEDSFEIYASTGKFLLSGKMRPIILVDWSAATIAERYQLLRAAIPLGGRAITLYEEVHELINYNNPKVHKAFLKKLFEIVPRECSPIIVTDAGFSVPWFKQVASLGWDFVGRVINKSCYRKEGGDWESIPSLLKYNRRAIKRVGQVTLTKKENFKCYLHVHKAAPKKRVRKNVYGERAARSVSVKNAKSAKQAWVLATSLGDSQFKARRVVEIYAMRMQIEECFRDIKSPRYGFGLRNSRSTGIKRLSNLFLIGMLATIIAWLIGLCAIKREIHYSLQTNSKKYRKVLSTFFIGCKIILHEIRFTKTELLSAFQGIKELVHVY